MFLNKLKPLFGCNTISIFKIIAAKLLTKEEVNMLFSYFLTCLHN